MEHRLPATRLIDAEALVLDQALQLLQQAGALLPDQAPYSAAWLQAVLDALCDLSSKDALTGLVNRRSFEMALAREADRVARSGEAALLLVLDIDHFKAVNDAWGHLAGDRVICAVAQACLARSRTAVDIVARFGGEEFVIVLPGIDTQSALRMAESLRNAVSAHNVLVDGDGACVTVTVSIGVATLDDVRGASFEELVNTADKALYRAKQAGRNNVQMAAPGPPARNDILVVLDPDTAEGRVLAN